MIVVNKNTGEWKQLTETEYERFFDNRSPFDYEVISNKARKDTRCEK